MAIVRWDPFGEMTNMQREIDRIFGRLGFGHIGLDHDSDVSWMPRVDVRTTETDMVVYAELPGMERDDIDVEVVDDVLMIRGTRESKHEKTDEGWLIRERSFGSFERSLALPEGIDTEKITADYKDGVLEVHVPRPPEAVKSAPRRITLGTGADD